MKIRTFLTIALTISSFSTFAFNLSEGEKVPAIGIEDKGELIIQDGEIIYQPWHSDVLVGKIRVIHAIAGRSSSKALNAPLMDAIIAANFNSDLYQTTTIVNQKDALWGTGSFVKSSLEDSKNEFPHSSMVLDAEGEISKSWDLKNKSSAIIVLDKDGKALWMKEGALSEQDVSSVLQLVKDKLP
jgi:YtfJ family uncharacterized protein